MQIETLALRGAAVPCREHWHWEAVGLLPGNVVAHFYAQDHLPTEAAAMEDLVLFAECLDATLTVVSHAGFEHSNRPELERQEREHEDETDAGEREAGAWGAP